ncbi:MAG: glycosyltransferase [Blastocatellia bacterium]
MSDNLEVSESLAASSKTIKRMGRRNQTMNQLTQLIKAGRPGAPGLPRVSVIMPAYRAAEYIGVALDSILAQTFSDYEIIVVNDGSPDGPELEQALSPYRGRITYIEQPNAGPSAARNTAIRQARGEFLAFLDADDYWKPNFLTEQVAFLEQNPGTDLVYCDGLLVGDTALAGRTFMELTPSVGEVTFESLLTGDCTVILSGTVVCKRVVVAAGLFDEALRYSEDYDLWLRLARNGSSLGCQPRVLLYKRIHGESLSADRVRLHQSALGVIEKYKRGAPLSENTRRAMAAQEARLTALVKREIGKQRLAQGECAEALQAFKEAESLSGSWKLRATLFCLRRGPRLTMRGYSLLALLGGQPRHGGSSSQRGGSLTTRAALYMFAKVVAFALSFMLPLLLVRRLSQHEFGLYKQVFLIVGTALSILPLGVGMSAYYFLPRDRERQGQVILNILVFYFFMAGGVCLLLALRPQVLGVIFNSQELTGYAPLIGVVILLWVVSSFLEIAAVAHDEVRLATVFVVGAQFTKTALLLAAMFMFETVWGLIYAALLQGVLQVCVLLLYLRSRFGVFWRRFEWAMMRRQLAYALPLGVAAVILGLQSDIDNYFVAYRFGTAEYAIYAIGCFQLPLIGIISESIGSVMIPRVSFLQKAGQPREIVHLTAKMIRKLTALYLPLYVLLLVAGREFLTVLFTEQYLPSYPIFAINITLIPLAILSSACDPIMRAYAEHRYFLLRVRVLLLGGLVGALWLVTGRYGMVGTISAAISVCFVERLVTAGKAGRVMGVERRDLRLLRDPGKLVAAAAIAGVLAALLRTMLAGRPPLVVLLVVGATFALTYALLTLSFNVLTRAEIEAFKQQLRRLGRVLVGVPLAPRHEPSPCPDAPCEESAAAAQYQVGALTDKAFWDSTHAAERDALAGLAQGAPIRQGRQAFAGVKRLIKGLLGRRVLEYARSYEDYILWDVLYQKYLPSRPGLKVLEVGSAPGDHLARLSQRFGLSPYGIEYSEIGVRLNRQVFAANGIDPDNVIDADFLGDEVQGKYRGQFDIVMSRGFIEHFADARAVVERHIDLLAEGGLLVVSVPNLNGLNYVLGKFFHKELIPLHNLDIMKKPAFMRLFDNQGVTPLFCDYYGTFNFGLYNTGQRALLAALLSFCMKLQWVLNIALRLLFKDRGAESRAFSPALIFIGVKSTPIAEQVELAGLRAAAPPLSLATPVLSGESK